LILFRGKTFSVERESLFRTEKRILFRGKEGGKRELSLFHIKKKISNPFPWKKMGDPSSLLGKRVSAGLYLGKAKRGFS